MWAYYMLTMKIDIMKFALTEQVLVPLLMKIVVYTFNLHVHFCNRNDYDDLFHD